ncbi:MAG: nucleotide exchange factor GrpE [Actinomycetota bacterium]|nr:nucleotide exchange factor GrpE [Actinomycetota bacterium]
MSETGPGVDPVPPSEGARRNEEPAATDALSLAEVEDRWRRAAADLENYRRRFDRELDRGRLAEREAVLGAWLGVVDALEHALAYARDNAEGLRSGLESVVDEAHRVLQRFGYQRLDETDVVFDPARHEVVAVVPADDDHPSGTVVHVTRPGWAGKDRVLRPASVVVARARE